LLALAAVVLVVAGVVAYVLVNRSGNDKKPSAKPSLGVPGEVLDTNGELLASLLGDARDHTFHARYTVRADAKVVGGTLSLEWWNKKGHSRVDTTRTSGSDVVKTASIVDGDDGALCQKTGGQGWSCHKISVPAPGDPNGMLASLTAQLSGRSITEHDGTVRGHKARCFHVSASAGAEAIDVCTDADGVLLRNASSDVSYEIADLDSDVPDSVFKAPAAVH
jgi:hypothetical protein